MVSWSPMVVEEKWGRGGIGFIVTSRQIQPVSSHNLHFSIIIIITIVIVITIIVVITITITIIITNV